MEWLAVASGGCREERLAARTPILLAHLLTYHLLTYLPRYLLTDLLTPYLPLQRPVYHVPARAARSSGGAIWARCSLSFTSRNTSRATCSSSCSPSSRGCFRRSAKRARHRHCPVSILRRLLLSPAHRLKPESPCSLTTTSSTSTMSKFLNKLERIVDKVPEGFGHARAMAIGA